VVDGQSGNEAASWIPMLNDKTMSCVSRKTSSLIVAWRKVFKREVCVGSDGCKDSSFGDMGRIDMFAKGSRPLKVFAVLTI